MDFSSIPRALESLTRRQPPIEAEALTLAGQLSSTTDSTVFLNAVQGLLENPEERWETLAVAVFVATETLQDHSRKWAVENADRNVVHGTVYLEGPRVPSTTAGDSFQMPSLSDKDVLQLCQSLHEVALKHLEHKEPRVRALVARAVGAYAKATHQLGGDAHMRQQIHERLVQSIHEHIVLGRHEKAEHSKSSTGAMDDTTGWRALETNWQCLAALVSAIGPFYLAEFPLTDHILEDCKFSAITHVNRHVRAAGMAVLEQIIMAVLAGTETDHALLRDSASALRTMTIEVLVAGLADNWSQVRMAASVLCRVFLTTLTKLQAPVDDVYVAILPRMCLNRFYLAQGVKIYSHETWKLIFPDSGLPLIVANLPAVCRYYIQMCDADNHVVREGACQAIAELAVRLGENAEFHDKLLPHLDALIQALLMCFHDESWPVRDEACLACGILCKAYPDECRAELKTLWQRWTEQLTDPIWSVREDAAVALGDALEAYGADMMDRIRDLLKQLLPSARDQPAMTKDEFRAHMNDIEAHTGAQMYSCGSLAPKLRKGGAGRIGCSTCAVDRPKAPWEATDGCVYLLREICIRCTGDAASYPLPDSELVPLLTELADVCRVQHFPQSDDLRATLWRQLPVMAKAMGKQRFKATYLDIFMELLFSSLASRSASQLSRHAAGQCAEELANLVGPAIFRGRLDDYQRETFDAVIRERQLMPKGPASDSFSPFGPADLLASVGKRDMHPGIGLQ